MSNAIIDAYQSLEKLQNDLLMQLDQVKQAMAALRPPTKSKASKVALITDNTEAKKIIEQGGGMALWVDLKRRARGRALMNCQTEKSHYSIRLFDYGNLTRKKYPSSREVARYSNKEEAYQMRDQLTAIMEGR